jgi:hypothetical protein
MTTHLSGSPRAPASARLFVFPPRGRFAVGQAVSQTQLSQANTEATSAVKIASASGWYHDDAILAEQRLKS